MCCVRAYLSRTLCGCEKFKIVYHGHFVDVIVYHGHFVDVEEKLLSVKPRLARFVNWNSSLPVERDFLLAIASIASLEIRAASMRCKWPPRCPAPPWRGGGSTGACEFEACRISLRQDPTQ